MGIMSEVGSFIKNTAARLRALLTITQVPTSSTEDANNSSRNGIIGAAGDGPIGEGGSGRAGGGYCDSNIHPLVEEHVSVPVDSLAASIDTVSMLRSFPDDGNGVRPTALSDRMFMNYCFTLLSRLVRDMIQGSTGSVQEHREIRDIELRLPYFVNQDLREGASSSRTTNTGSTLVGDGGRHNQDPKMKEFRKFAYWITALFIAILLGLISANKRQPGPLFRSCRSLVIVGAICCIAMLMLTLILPSSQRALTCLKMMQYLTVGLLFVATVLIFTLL